MNRFTSITLSALTCLIACNPLDKPKNPNESPKQDNENAEENYTPEIPTDDKGYNGGTENIISDATTQVDESYYPEGIVAKDEKRNGAIYSKGSAVFSGNAYDVAINVGGDNPVGIEINGGLVIGSGSAAPEEGLDCDKSQNFIVKGGTLIGTGRAAVSTSTTSTQRSVIYNGVSAKTGDLFVVVDEEGTPILKYELPRAMNSMAVFFSSPDIKQGKIYTVYSGGH